MEGIINIAGAMPRIGTTTQCLQLAKYIQSCSDYKVAYVECNSQDYIWSASEMYQSVRGDKTGGLMTIEGVNMYNQSRLPELTKGGVDIDFLICDYGDVESQGFNKESFLKGTVKALVAGVKPNEIHYTEKALRDKAYEDAIYIFSHVPISDREELMGLMGKHAADTFFSPYIPDPFQNTNEAILPYYEKLMPHIINKIGR